MLRGVTWREISKTSSSTSTAKVGLEFFTAHGLSGVQKIVDLGFRIFLDLKLHDIPNTVRGALKSVVNLPAIDMLTIHVSGRKKHDYRS
ncbi:hypothetical protein O998_02430 [Anaplasma phagocytophilum str. Norway variant1]|uniref:Orotidine 5'-phosphate decarboxylase n=1 Tax=Anaplasma phagocytophilum str. Norway variant1 TaxID=1392506 RepID=A0A7H9DYP2_ANAPH|nr:orotidine 5'-phosphate decarboxylase / HUMPS family protein [Anaplasma phagocytophilum]QLL66684.1 hypothetical protein O998_02430 [Anaplasma phagocytophilum str. Norway variant1]